MISQLEKWGLIIKSMRLLAVFFTSWIPFNFSGTNQVPTVLIPLVFVISSCITLVLWREIGNRTEGFLFILLWYFGAGYGGVEVGNVFFGNSFSVAVIFILALAHSLPVVLLPHRLLPFSLAIASLLSAFSPFGVCSPFLASMSLFPGTGFIGLFFSVCFLSITGFKNRTYWSFSLGMFLIFALVANIRYTTPKPPSGLKAVDTINPSAVFPVESWELWVEGQHQTKALVSAALDSGALVVVTPEGSTIWNSWSEALWREVGSGNESLAPKALLGTYRFNRLLDGYENGILDIATGDWYGAVIPMPIGMWHPWDVDGHFPIDMSNVTRLIPTPWGPAAYLICYEEMLPLILAIKMISGSPSIIITIANQWFGKSSDGYLAQYRSLLIQARLWGIPHLRAVNRPHQAANLAE